jgi:hypothetical protein
MLSRLRARVALTLDFYEIKYPSGVCVCVCPPYYVRIGQICEKLFFGT